MQNICFKKRAKQGHTESNWSKQGQRGSNSGRAKQGQAGPNGLTQANWGQPEPTEAYPAMSWLPYESSYDGREV